MKVIYDLDGTLVDTREAVRQAYAVAGVVMPDDAWGKPAQDWLPRVCDDPIVAHQLKCVAYANALRYHGRQLPLLQELSFHKQTVTVITGASRQAVNTLYKMGILPSFVKVVAVQQTRRSKVDWLARHGWGTYVDDDAEVRRLVLDQTLWSVDVPEQRLEELRQR